MGLFEDIYQRLANSLWMTRKSPDFGYGLRNSGVGNKGLGYYGPLPNVNGGESTEVSAFDDMARGEYPLLVPGLTQEELDSVLKNDPVDSVYEKAAKHAEMRKTVGASPFASVFDSLFRDTTAEPPLFRDTTR